MTERRDFLRQVGMGVAGAPVLGSLLAIRRAFGEALDGVPAGGAGLAPQDLRGQYMLSPDVTYLNHASIGTMPSAVHDARVGYLAVCESNPWLHMWGGAWEAPREEVRRKAAAVLGCAPEEVAVTHNTTEAFNILAHGLPLEPGDEVLFSTMNHEGASAAFAHAAARGGFRVNRFAFPLLDVPRMSADEIVSAYVRHITPATRLLVFPHIDNIVGIRYPVRRLADEARRRGVEFIAVDGAQSVGMIPVNLAELGVDAYATSPHKWLQAAKGLGLAYFSRELQERLRPMWVTWGQGRWRGTVRIFEDYGTRNFAEVLSLGDAIDFHARIDPPSRDEGLQRLWRHARRRVEEHPALGWASPTSWELGSSVYGVTIRGRDAAELAARMFAEHGIVFRPFDVQGLNAVRLSPNLFNTEEELDRFFEIALG